MYCNYASIPLLNDMVTWILIVFCPFSLEILTVCVFPDFLFEVLSNNFDLNFDRL